jgi:hypothetical protein
VAIAYRGISAVINAWDGLHEGEVTLDFTGPLTFSGDAPVREVTEWGPPVPFLARPVVSVSMRRLHEFVPHKESPDYGILGVNVNIDDEFIGNNQYRVGWKSMDDSHDMIAEISFIAVGPVQMKWWSKALLVLFSLVIAMALVEVGLWLFGIEYPTFFEYDPIVGSKLRPGIKGHWLKEGGGYVSINSDGLRDREHSLEKPPNTVRIAVLGDSFAQANQVNQEETFWATMEKILQDCGNFRGQKVEVINFGISGLSTTQELLVLRHKVWKYSPDIILLAVYTNNDVAENSKVLAIQWNFKSESPFFSYQNGELVLDNPGDKRKHLGNQEEMSKREKFYQWLRDNVRTYQLVQECRKLAWGWWLQVQQREKEAAAYGLSAVDAQKAIFHKPNNKAWEDAWRITEGVLLKMRDEVTSKGAKFFVVVLTVDVQVYPDPEVRERYAKSIGVKDLSYPDQRLEKFCQQQGIPVLVLAPAFQEYTDKHHVYFHGFKNFFGFSFGLNYGYGHWNQNGHRLAGKLIAEWLCKQVN